jgi:peptidylprolyl isomerase
MIRFASLVAALAVAVPAAAQDAGGPPPPPPAPTAETTVPAAEWRTIPAENLLVIDTVHGRILVELEPRMAPRAVERIRTLADQGFYDGLKFHRVIPDFMAQTGDPLGTGQGGSDLPDLPGEFQFRRGRDAGFVPVMATPQGQAGIIGSVPVITQPDAQMMVTADFKAGAQGLFCPGVAGMARASSPDSANSQFFLMTGPKDSLNGNYTPFGRVVAGMDVVRAIKAGSEASNGAVTDPDVMTRTRTALALPEGERPTVRVATGAALQAEVERVRAERGAAFTICDVQPPAEVAGG